MIDNMNEALPIWEQWWNRENRRAVFYTLYPQGCVEDIAHLVKPWMPKGVTGEWSNWKPEMLGALALERYLADGDPRPIEEWLDYMEAYAELYGHVGGGYRFLLPGLGPTCLAVFLSGYFRYFEPTVWAETPTAMSYDEIVAAIDNPPPHVVAYREGAALLYRRTAERLGGTYLIGMADINDGLDTLSPLRHNLNLLTDFYDVPEEIHRTLDRVGKYAQEVYSSISALIDPVNGGATACVMRFLSAQPSYLTYCDFSAMIGPDMFEKFVLPTVARHCARFPGRTVYHLDGVGQIPHVPLLCSVDELSAIQWVQGAGKPQPTDECWDDLYRQILDAGKRICISWSNREDLARLFTRFPASEFAVLSIAKNREEALEICRL